MKLLMENWRQYLTENVDEEDVMRVVKKYHDPSRGVKRLDLNIIEDPMEKMIIRAIYLFTSSMGNTDIISGKAPVPTSIDAEYDTIRDSGSRMSPREKYEMLPTQEDYKTAINIMKNLGTMSNPFPNRPAYRSRRLGEAELEKLLEVGVHDLGPARSWSLDPTAVTRFAMYKLTPERPIVVFFEIPRPTKGMPIYNFSRSPEEEEIMIGGKIKIVKAGKLLWGKEGHRELRPNEGFIKLICENI